MNGINLANKDEDNAKQGLVFTSISQTFLFSSIIKSKPNISKDPSLLLGSTLP